MAESKLTPVAPKFSIGQVVAYLDHHGRAQEGAVLSAEAHWDRIYGEKPTVGYTVRHPTYKNRWIHLGERDLSASAGT